MSCPFIKRMNRDKAFRMTLHCAAFVLLAMLLAMLVAHAQPEQPLPDILSTEGILFLVNRGQKVTKRYVPPDLVVPRVDTRKQGMDERIMLRQEAALALENLFQAAKSEGNHVLYAASGYRSFGSQQVLFDAKVKERGKDRAQRTVAPPGASEHQLGLAMDVQCPAQLNLNQNFAQTDEGKWLAANAHRFGFVIRYQAEWRDVTGYAYEPWHIRYLGIAHASALYRLNIPFETYHACILTLPEYVLTGASDLLLEGLVQQMLATPEVPAPQVLVEAAEDAYDEALRAATAPFLPEGTTYEQALWACYPTPAPTSPPYQDRDEEATWLMEEGGG